MTLVRWSGIGVMLAGILLPLYAILHPAHDETGYASLLWLPVHALPSIAMVLMLFGLTGLLVRQLQQAGRLGVVGYIVASLGTAMVLTHGQVELWVVPFIGLNAPHLMQRPNPPPTAMVAILMLTFLVFFTGYVLLGIATARAGVLPRSLGVLLAIGGAAFAVGYFIGQIPIPLVARATGVFVFGAVLLWLGRELWAGDATERAAAMSGTRTVAAVTERM